MPVYRVTSGDFTVKKDGTPIAGSPFADDILALNGAEDDAADLDTIELKQKDSATPFDLPETETLAGTWTWTASVQANGSITCVAKADLIDGETVVLTKADTGGTVVTFEFDVTGDGVVLGNIPVDVSAAVSANDVAVALAAAIDAGHFTAPVPGGAVVAVTQLGHGTPGDVAITETVADAGFTVTGFTGGIDGLTVASSDTSGVTAGLDEIRLPGADHTYLPVTAIDPNVSVTVNRREPTRAILAGTGAEKRLVNRWTIAKTLDILGIDTDGAKAEIRGGHRTIFVNAAGKDVSIKNLHLHNGHQMGIFSLRARDLAIEDCDITADTHKGRTLWSGIALTEVSFGILVGSSGAPKTHTGTVSVQRNKIEIEQDSGVDRTAVDATANGAWTPGDPHLPNGWSVFSIDVRSIDNGANATVKGNTIKNATNRGLSFIDNFGTLVAEDNTVDIGALGSHTLGDVVSSTGISVRSGIFFSSGTPDRRKGRITVRNNLVIAPLVDQAAYTAIGSDRREAGGGKLESLAIVKNRGLLQAAAGSVFGILVREFDFAYVGQNHLEGQAKVGILMGFDPNRRNATDNNAFVGNNIKKLTSSLSMLVLTADARNNAVIGSGMANETVIDDGDDNLITGHAPVPGGVGAALQAILDAIKSDHAADNPE